MLKKKIKAFSLIEILAVVAIVGIITAASWGLLGKGKKASDIHNACTQVAGIINKARNYTISGKYRTVTVTVSGGTVVISGDVSESYTFRGVVTCSGAGPFTYTAPSGIGNVSGVITCSSPTSTDSRVVNVTPYNAVCN